MSTVEWRIYEWGKSHPFELHSSPSEDSANQLIQSIWIDSVWWPGEIGSNKPRGWYTVPTGLQETVMVARSAIFDPDTFRFKIYIRRPRLT